MMIYAISKHILNQRLFVYVSGIVSQECTIRDDVWIHRRNTTCIQLKSLIAFPRETINYAVKEERRFILRSKIV